MRSLRSYLVNGLLRAFAKRRFDPATDLIAYRAHLQRLDERLYSPPEGVSLGHQNADGVYCEQIDAGGEPAPRVLLYLHGGGFFLRTPRLHARLAARLATELRCSALIPDYRLAPEHPFPAASEDCFRTYRWLLERGVAAGDIVIAGDSAGGNLTLTTLFRVRDAGLPPPACAICLSPGTDLSLGGVTLVSNERRDPMFRLQTLVIMKNAYIGGASPTEPLVSPIYGDFRGLPPVLFQAGDTELLLDHSTRAYERARRAGLRTQLSVWRGMPHVFQAFASLPESRRAIDEIGAFVREVAGWSAPAVSSHRG
jgi:acetyl esterase/lipase